MARLNRLVELFERDQPAFGVFCGNLSTRSAAALGASGLDFVFVDFEHTPYDLTRLEAFLLALHSRGRVLEKGSLQPDVVPLVRIPSYGRENLQLFTKQVLDLGAMGVVAPHVSTPGEALNAVRAARFPPMRAASDHGPGGQRGIGYGWACHVWGVGGEEYARVADLWPLDPDGELLLIPMIETGEAVRDLEQILDVPGIGAVFIGPSDLAASLGLPDGHPDVEPVLDQVARVCRSRGIPCGAFASASNMEQRLAQGFRLIALGGDTGLPAAQAAALAEGRRLREGTAR